MPMPPNDEITRAPGVSAVSAVSDVSVMSTVSHFSCSVASEEHNRGAGACIVSRFVYYYGANKIIIKNASFNLQHMSCNHTITRHAESTAKSLQKLEMKKTIKNNGSIQS
jgi:hypothetical protein